MIDLIKTIAKKYNISVLFNEDGKLTEESLQEFKDRTDWWFVSQHYKLSEEFIREFQDKVTWYGIVQSQVLSEEFIKEFQDKMTFTGHWDNISMRQELSEEFIREFQDKMTWNSISSYQKLSEDFIRKILDEVNIKYIYKYQKLSKKFRKEFKLNVPKTCWLYKSKRSKLDYIKNNTNYEIVDDEFIIAYKAVRRDGRSVYSPNRYKYKIGEIYESNCDYNIDIENSFGLAAWTKYEAIDYYHQGNLLKVKINIEDIGAIVQSEQKIRCCKLTVLNEEEF